MVATIHETADLEICATDAWPVVAQASKPAVSRVFKPAGVRNCWTHLSRPTPAHLEVGDEADLKLYYAVRSRRLRAGLGFATFAP